MENKNMFEVAARNKFRFPFKGLISVEDLYDLRLEDLDAVFKSLNSELKKDQEESLLNTRTKENADLELKIEIVKHIVSEKLDERDAKAKERENAALRQRLLEIKSVRQNRSLENLSDEDLDKMLGELK